MSNFKIEDVLLVLLSLDIMIIVLQVEINIHRIWLSTSEKLSSLNKIYQEDEHRIRHWSFRGRSVWNYRKLRGFYLIKYFKINSFECSNDGVWCGFSRTSCSWKYFQICLISTKVLLLCEKQTNVYVKYF